ncbi:MAG TPA: ATP-binding cassette domain-containing protein [Spirochaetia bacterium]|nr:ATP-binding cassette domain-containing protein [Spirochaetia bacterium]
MISTSSIALAYGKRVLFKEVSIKFTPGNCYGIIGANGAGKSTFLNILSGELQPDSGDVIVSPGERVAVLAQDQFQFDEHTVLHTVIMGYSKLYELMVERQKIYEKEDFTEEDGIRASHIETEFAERGGWEAESEAGTLLAGLGLDEGLLTKSMRELDGGQKVRVLLAQALFGNPDILLLDEPTNHLDLDSIRWLEEFLFKFKNTVIVVSHDRHFLNRVCTHIADIDFGKIQLFVGNYDFWYQSSQLAAKQARDDKRRREDKIAELREFIQRFASNAAKSRQATSRQKLIEKLTVDDLRPSLRKFPYINFTPERELGKNVLEIKRISKKGEEGELLHGFNLTVQSGEKVAFVGPEHQAKTSLFQILAGETSADAGGFDWGVTTNVAYFPKENAQHFDSDLSITDWLRQYSPVQEEAYVRGFLGRMLFSGDESLKSVRVLSGGERVRCLIAKMMLSGANVLILDEPTNHLDLESISALNNALIDFSGSILFTSHDHQFLDTIANRIVEFVPGGGVIDRMMRFDDYVVDEEIGRIRDKMHRGEHLSLSL